MEGPVSNIAERFFKRNMNGIGRTDVTINNGPPTTIVHASAKVAALSIEKSRIQTQLEKPDWTRTEYGAIEGEILSTTTLYNKPALIIKERLSGGKISCILSSELAQRVGPKHSWDETWGQRRFAITGALYYDTEGNLKKVDATDLREITPSPVDLEELRSLDIVGGESSEATYLRLWGNG